MGAPRGETTARSNSLELFQTPHLTSIQSSVVFGQAGTHGYLLREQLSNLHPIPPAECVSAFGRKPEKRRVDH